MMLLGPFGFKFVERYWQRRIEEDRQERIRKQKELDLAQKAWVDEENRKAREKFGHDIIF